jgi:hypothetical protein
MRIAICSPFVLSAALFAFNTAEGRSRHASEWPMSVRSGTGTWRRKAGTSTIDEFRNPFCNIVALQSVHHNVIWPDAKRAIRQSEDWPANVVSTAATRGIPWTVLRGAALWTGRRIRVSFRSAKGKLGKGTQFP